MPPLSFRLVRLVLCAGAAATVCGPAPAQAQILGGGGLPALPGRGLPSIGDPLPDLPRPVRSALPATAHVADEALQAKTRLGAVGLTQLRAAEVARLLHDHPDVVEADDRGAPVVRGEVLALSPAPEALERARRAGFRVGRVNRLEALGLQTVALTAPRGLSARDAVARLRVLDPAGQYDFDHLYQQSGAVGAAAAAAQDRAPPVARGAAVRLGLVDGAVAANAPTLRRARLVQRAFAPGGAQVSAHATAVASLLAGDGGRFHGSAPGATVFAADVYGPTPAGGSAEAIVRALAWLADSRVAVVNVSLVGPPNLLMGAAVKAMIARGYVLVAAVGNDGPAAPPLYPASYPGVIAVTAVDAARRVLPEAGRGSHLDFAAPGAQMAAASLDGGFVAVRGTSFAAPIVAGEIARRLAQGGPDAARGAIAALGRDAVDLGAPGPDPVYGRGLVGFDLRTDPQAVGARAVALRGP